MTVEVYTAEGYFRSRRRTCVILPRLTAEDWAKVVPGDETIDIGEDTGTPSADYRCPFRFTGKIETVTFDLK